MHAYRENGGGLGSDRYGRENGARRPIAAPHHFCKHLYHAGSSAAAYAPGIPSLVVWIAYGGMQDREAVGSVLARGMKGQRACSSFR